MTDLLKVIEDAKDLHEAEMVVPEWGNVRLLLKEMDGLVVANVLSVLRPSVSDVSAKEGSLSADSIDGDLATKIMDVLPKALSSCIFDPDTREQVFVGEAGVAVLTKKSTMVLMRIFNKVAELSGIDSEGMERAKEA